MDQQQLLKPIPSDKMSMFSKDELITLLRGEQDLRRQLEIDNDRLRNLNEELKQKRFYIEEQYVTLKNKFFGKSSEKQPSAEDKKKNLKKQVKKTMYESGHRLKDPPTGPGLLM